MLQRTDEPDPGRSVAQRAGQRARSRLATRAPLTVPLARTLWRLSLRAAIGAGSGALVATAALALDGAIGWELPFGAARVRDVVITLTGASLTIAVFALWMRSIVVSLVAGVFHARTLSTYLDDGFQRAMAAWMVGAFSVLVTVAVASPSADEAGAPPVATFLALVTIVVALLGILVAVRHGAERLDTSDLVHQLAERGLRILEETEAIADDPAPAGEHEVARAIDATTLGWVRNVDRHALVTQLPEHATATLLVAPGSFVAPGQTVLTIDTAVDEATADRLRGAFEVGRSRDPHSDLGYSIDELSDVIQHAAGPGSDAGTAREALFHLEALVGRMIARGLPTGHLQDGTRSLIAVAQPRVADHARRVTERLHGAAPGDPVTAKLVEEALDRLCRRAEEVGDTDTVEAIRQADRT